jgi:putative methionine-R-sulfoxide reductase with GAF domain
MELAQRDLDATLQLLAERAKYITGASGAAIALRDDGGLICRATAGPCAPELGAHLQVNSGLTGESVRTKQILRCDNAEQDARVNRESCRALGIASVVVVPLVRSEEVYGVFELLSGEPAAFRERDIVALQRLAEMVQTALDHADAAFRVQQGDISAAPVATSRDAAASGSALDPIVRADPLAGSGMSFDSFVRVQSMEEFATVGSLSPEHSLPTDAHRNVAKCERCGFPVSEGRTLCLDCEMAKDTTPAYFEPAGAAFLSQYAAEPTGRGWLRSHLYLIGIGVMAALTAVVLLLRH